MRVISLGVLTALFAYLGWLMAAARVKISKLWKVELADQQQLTVNVGDMILAMPRTLRLVPASIQKIFEVSYDQNCLRLVAEEPVERARCMGKEFCFLVLSRGRSEVTVRIKEQNQILETMKLNVTCR